MLRVARTDDAEQIARLHVASWRATYARELSAAFLTAQDLATRGASWRRELERGVAVLLVEEGGELTGFVASGPVRGAGSESGAWEIYSLHVSPSRHGLGIGSRLFTSATQLGRDRGAPELVLWVVESNSLARRFYERKGMQCDGAEQEHRVGLGQSLREVRYRMKLADSKA